ncbi:TRAP transporter large permease subunit [Rhizobium sp. S152]|uniref:TRAP transporter large permease n=1 Tax=Rhizobium sp. S152 TaxID=3055038 RepID=UPI0025A96589|nr:TRAP transporter large permease subunit [Rhizobium sp. S152]MDM9625082.1 TRAP transporter large permease subunit [Rhizobium sp. S152]
METVLGLLIDIPAALFVVAEVMILFVGVVSRYSHNPIIWSDELASILFLWLAMFGAAAAFRRGEHMRMTALISKVTPPRRKFFDLLALGAGLTLMLALLHPAFNYASEEWFITTPALEISGAWRAAALPIGLILMIATALLRLVENAQAKALPVALGCIIAAVAALWALAPVLDPLGNINLLIFFVLFVASMVFMGIPIAFSFALATLGFLWATTSMPLEVVVGRMDEGMSHLILLAVPLFVFLGLLIEATGMARAMVAVLANLLSRVRGGLSYVLIGAMYLVSGISGSKAADMAAIVPVLFPEMKERGAKPGDLVALLSATGAQTETIPPSLVLITIGSVTGVSIAALFTGGLLPAAVLGIALAALVWWRYRHEDVSGVERVAGKAILKSFLFAVPALALPFVIRAAVIEGIATATEVSTLGIAYVLTVGIVFYGGFNWRRTLPMLVSTAALSGAILLIIGAATAMAWALTQSGFSRQLADMMMALPGGGLTFLIVSALAFIVLGSVLEGIPAIVLFGPLLFPIAQGVGIHEVHYAMVVILAMGIGLFAPPFGVGYYSACAIAGINPDEGMKPILGYIGMMLIGLAIVIAVPWVSIGFL